MRGLVVAVALGLGGCVWTALASQMQKNANGVRGLSNVPPRTVEFVDGYCAGRSTATWPDAYTCQAAADVAVEATRVTLKAPLLGQPGARLLGTATGTLTLMKPLLGTIRMAWDRAIKQSVEAPRMGATFDWHESLMAAEAAVEGVGAAAEMNALDKRIKALAMADGSNAALDVAVCVREVIALSRKPTGSLDGYRSRIDETTARCERNMMRLEMQAEK